MGKIFLVMFLAVLLAPACLLGQELDGLLDEGNDGSAVLEGEKRLSVKEIRRRVADAMSEANPVRRRKRLLLALKSLVGRTDIVFQPRELRKFLDAVMSCVPAGQLRPLVRKFLRQKDKMSFNPGARTHFNIAIKLSLVAGGISFDELKQILREHGAQVDMEWLLPALGRAGGRKAIPILMRYRKDKSIIGLNNYQNIRRVPCAAVLGCAYAGDKAAFETILDWYEQDSRNRSRFAFYVAWTIQEGRKPSYALLDYCQHRIRQAERLLDTLGGERVRALIERANRRLLVALPGYLIRRMTKAPRRELPVYIGLLDHSSLLVRQRVLEVLVARGDANLRERVMEKVRALQKSPRGLDRLFAADAIKMLEPKESRKLLGQVTAKEKNRAVRRRLRMLIRD